MGVLLVNPPTLAALTARGLAGTMSYFEYEGSFTSQDNYRSYPGEHLGLMALAAALRSADVPVTCVNGQVESHRSLGETWQAMLDAGQSMDVDLIGFSGPCQVFEENAELARRARREWPNAFIAIGHHFATLNWQRILADYPEFDVAVLGDGETSIFQLATADGESDLAAIDGIAWRASGGELRMQPPPVEPVDLDGLPEVARDDLPKVLKIGVSAALYTTRGCPYRCSYCTTGQTAGMLHKKLGYRERSISLVIDEVERLARDYEIPHLTITDDLFVTKAPESLARAVDFAEAYRSRGIKVPFMVDCRLDSVDPDVFRELARAGLHRVFVGIETGSGEQLVFYNKRYGAPYDVAYVKSRVRSLQELGIDVIPGLLTYNPGSTEAELSATLDVIDACNYESTWLFLAEVFAHPGTPLWHHYRRAGWLTEEWPEPSWTFQDPWAEKARDAVLRAVDDGGGHDEARAAFAHVLGEWRRSR